MDKDIILLILGGVIGFLSSLLTTFLLYFLDGLRIKRQWLRDDDLRQEQRRYEEKKFTHDFMQKTSEAKIGKMSIELAIDDKEVEFTADQKEALLTSLSETLRVPKKNIRLMKQTKG